MEFGNIAAAIASKPDNSTVASFLNVNVTGSAIPANGIYLPAANTLGLAANSTLAISINSTGAVTIAAPSAGVALTLTAFAGSNGLVVNQAASSAAFAASILGAATAGQSLGLFIAAGTGAADAPIQIKNQAQTRTLLTVFGDGHVILGDNGTSSTLTSTALGNVSVAAPTSGDTLSLAGAANGRTLVLTASATSGQSKGLVIFGGTTSADFALAVANQANTATLFEIFGDGHFVLGNNGTTNTVTSTAAGNVSITAPTSGVTLAVAGFSGVHSTRISDSATNLFNAGFLEVPASAVTGGFPYTTVLSDSGKQIINTGAGAVTVTIAANASVAYPVGTVLTFVNDASAAVNMTIAITSDTLVFSPSGATGSRTLAQFGKASAVKVSATRWYIGGTGLS